MPATGSETEPNKGGRPTEYRPEYNEQARKLCLLGATDAQLADFFGVSETTINNWKLAHPEFLESLKAGKEKADALVAHALYHRAIGYKHDAVKILTVADGNNSGSHVEEMIRRQSATAGGTVGRRGSTRATKPTHRNG